MGLRILVVGSGGREHALTWALARSPSVEQVFVAPGNGGTEWPAASVDGSLRASSENVAISSDDIPALRAFAEERQIDLTVVGPEGPLAAGIVDAFQAAGLPIFGPSAAAARLESSKAFTKDFLRETGIPTAAYATFSDLAAAEEYIAGTSGRVVVKADGLAAGKGVVVAGDRQEALDAARGMLQGHVFGDAGATIVVEERLAGREMSLLAFSDGRTVVPLPPARDHKRAFDGDDGPNTGGMGAYSPLGDVSPALIDELRTTVLQRAIDGMAARGTPYVGVLYAGLMLTPEGPRVLEFNCRFGDPETQAILPLLETDLASILLACVEGRLDEVSIQWRPGACATVVLAAPGYPGAYPKGLPISGVDAAAALADVLVFSAGTARRDGRLVTDGGRVLAVSGLGPDLPAALRHAYAGVERISFEGRQFRHDIGGTAAENVVTAEEQQ